MGDGGSADYEWMWGSNDQFFQKLLQSSSEGVSRSQSVDSSFHSLGSGCSSFMCEGELHLAAINKNQKAQLDAVSLRASKPKIGEKTMEKENTVLVARVSEVTTWYCILGVEYAAARDVIKKQRAEIVVTRAIAGFFVGITFFCLVVLFKLYPML